ncbi:DUF2746 domain-containing protein [uncultured phage cr8_1]|uniref:Uncharacterized protein n=1 Tax=uncultured phage cr8_1 TaxID=2772068 RepID=A0A7M1RYA6_9CAUD|nr:DUF2746 domain-containing protein [uncultured phage cr8_1]QOR58871.1 hypothetical protein [uncultured phage cr8_1]
MDSFSNEDSKGFVVVLVLTFVICCSMIIGKYYHTKNNNIIEQNIELQKHNDSLRIKVDNLDSIKNAKVIEVKALDNDSTIKLFYQLIK